MSAARHLVHDGHHAVAYTDERGREWVNPGHTSADFLALLDAGRDPGDVQYREHAVMCSVCGEWTWHLSARCDRHYEAPRAAS